MRWTRWLAAAVLLLASAPPGAIAAEPGGAALYRAHCARCHGPEGHGDGPEAARFAHRPRDLREGFLARYDDDELAERILAGRPLAVTADPATLHREVADLDALTAHLRAMPSVDWVRYTRGRRLYLERCEGCHGAFGEGAPADARLDAIPRDLGARATKDALAGAALAAAVRHARPGMPPLPDPPGEAQAADLVEFVAVLSPGHRLYVTYCAGCHGESGLGTTRELPDGARPKVRFDRAYFEEVDAKGLETMVWHMYGGARPRMPHLAEGLDRAQALAIVRYLRGLD